VPGRMRVVAVGAAVVAMLFTLVAVIVVVTRDGSNTTSAADSAVVRDRVVKAIDVVRLRNEVEVVVAAGTAKGVRVKDAALAQALGLADGDVITSLSGKPTVTERDVTDVIMKTSMMRATALYADVERAERPLLLRWKLDGDLRQARYDAPSSGLASLPAYATTPATPDVDLEPLLATIEKIDDTHYTVPRATVDALLANPLGFIKGARVVPSMRNGQADGFKLYAIRPSSPFAKLGLQNGDTIHAINDFRLDSADQALEVYTNVRDATEVTFDLTRRGKPVSLTLRITK
jgi:S1-C subfamily serine protease